MDLYSTILSTNECENKVRRKTLFGEWRWLIMVPDPAVISIGEHVSQREWGWGYFVGTCNL